MASSSIRTKEMLALAVAALVLLGPAAARAGSASPATSSVPAGCVTSAGAPCPTAPARGCATAAGFSGSAASRLREACPSPSAASTRSGADRYGYCSVAGNVDSNGTPLEPGSFLNLLLGQPESDAHYTGATPAFFVTGVGVTCSLSDSQAAQAAGSNARVNHTGGTGDVNQPDFYTLVG